MKFKPKYTTEEQQAEIVALFNDGHGDAITTFARDVADNTARYACNCITATIVIGFAAMSAIDLLCHVRKVKKEIAEAEKNKEQ